MANTQTASELVVTKFLSDFFKEYIRNNRFSRYTGTDMNSVINIKEGRQKIEIPLVTRLKGNGVSGSSTLRGNGESIGNYGMELAPTYKRHAVEFDREELEKPAIDLMKAARPLLMNWAMEATRDDVIEAMGAIHNGTSYYNYGDATGAQLDSWNTNNQDRILYGAAKSNLSAGNHTTSLANLDTTNDRLDTDIVSIAKRMAKTADPHITPIRTSEDEEWFVFFCDPYAFRDMKSSLSTSHQNAMPRSKDNPLFRDGDLVWDGVIIREIPEISDFIDASGAAWGAGATGDSLLTSGNGATRVGPCFLCGAQALGFGLGQRPRIVIDSDYDYGFQPGVAVELKHQIKKAFFDNHSAGTSSTHKQHGMVTVFVSAPVDS